MLFGRFSVLLSLFLFALASRDASPDVPVADDEQVVAIQTVIAEVRDALIGVQKTLRREKYPLLKSVTLVLQTTASTQVGGQVKLWVITIGKKWQKDKSQEVVIQLTPPSPDNARKVAAESLTAALESTIVSAVEGAQNAGSQQLPLEFTGLQASVSFTVKKGGSGGAKIELLPISADFSGDISTTAVHSIKVVYGALK